jgi:class 3 adenylate cyclase
LLARAEFENAVKEALRHYTQPDLLAENALLRTRLLTSSKPRAATPQALRALVAETAKALFASERDQRLYHVLDLTYLNPASKQEAAASRLGLPYSTYRRHLTAGVDRLTEWLWKQELEVQRVETVAEPTTGSYERVERKLAAIIAADVAGYSRLMGADEEGTLARLKAHRRELIDSKIAEYHGRIVKTTGDGLLVEFTSVVDATSCAVELQQRMSERNASEPADKRIEFRVGINLGDIIFDGDDVYGDGANIAARLEGLAEPGGICVSQTVLDHARGKVRFDIEDWASRPSRTSPSQSMCIASSLMAIAEPPSNRASLRFRFPTSRRSLCYRSRI